MHIHSSFKTENKVVPSLLTLEFGILESSGYIIQSVNFQDFINKL
jgi:hypothetical protein